jgi:DNA primase
VKELAARVDLGSVDGRSRFQAIAKPLLTRLPQGMYRTAVMDAFGAELRIAPDLLDGLMSDDRPAAPVPQRSAAAGPKRKTVVQKVINLALHYPRAAARTADAARLAALNQPGADLLRRVFAAAAEGADVNTARLLETLRDDPDYPYLERIVAERPLAIDDEEAAATELAASLEHLHADAERAADAQRIRGHTPGPGPAQA